MYELPITGIILSRLRKELDQTVRGQAAALGIAPSYLVDIQYGNRELSYNVFKKIIETYKGHLTTDDVTNLGIQLNSPDVYQRFSEVTGLSGFESINTFIYIVTGERL